MTAHARNSCKVTMCYTIFPALFHQYASRYCGVTMPGSYMLCRERGQKLLPSLLIMGWDSACPIRYLPHLIPVYTAVKGGTH